MTVDEWAIRDTARDLANLYRELDHAKYRPMQSRGERVMKPRPGPRVPGNWFMIALDADLIDHLVEMVCDARNHIEPGYVVGRDGRVLCEWVAWNANAISELDFAADLHDLMHDQARRLTKRLHPPGSDTPANPDPYLTAGSIQRTLTARGLECPEGTIRRWASEGHVTTRKRDDGRTLYRLRDVQTRLA